MSADPCPRAWDVTRLRNALIAHPGLTAVEACLALDALKRTLCPCHEVCGRYADQIAEAKGPRRGAPGGPPYRARGEHT